MNGRDWLDMTADEFSADTGPPALFTLTPANVPAPVDGCGTGDLFELLPPGHADE